jgi:chromosome segregation ATPase
MRQKTKRDRREEKEMSDLWEHRENWKQTITQLEENVSIINQSEVSEKEKLLNILYHYDIFVQTLKECL